MSEYSIFGEYITQLREVEELDVGVGLELTGGSDRLYISTLRTLAKRLPGLISSMVSCLDEGNYSRFAVDIHGLKSALATVGATELSYSALDLEMKAKEGNVKACKNLFPAFYDSISALHGRLRIILLTKANKVQQKGDVRRLKWRLEEVKCRLNEFDDEAALVALEALTEFDFGAKVNELLINLSDHVEMLDYENAGMVLSELTILLYKENRSENDENV